MHSPIVFFVDGRRLCLGGFCGWLFLWSLRRGWRLQLGFEWLFVVVLRLLCLVCRGLWRRMRSLLVFLGLRWLQCWRFRRRRLWCVLARWLVICLFGFRRVFGWIVCLLWFFCLLRLCFRSSMTVHRGFVPVLSVWMRIDYFVWCVVEVFIFDSYVYYSDAGSSYDWTAVADFRVDFDVRMFCSGFLQG